MAKNQSKGKVRTANYAVPRDRDEADLFIYRIGVKTRARAAMQSELDYMLAELKRRFEENAQPMTVEIDELTEGLQVWCEANRKELLDGDSKTVKFGNGEVCWRNRPASVTLRGVEKIIEWCRSHRLSRFIRIKREINKEAMLASPKKAEEIPGVTIASAGEDFIVTPLSAELEEVA